MISFSRQSRRVAAIVALSVVAWCADALAGQLDLTWVKNSTNEDGFSIERSPDAAGPFSEIDMTPSGITAYTDRTVADATTYCYRVRAFSATAYSDYSNIDCQTTASAASLAVVKMGTGTGTVISTPSGIICGATCSGTYPSGTTVTLTATPAPDSSFTGWSGDACAGSGSCTVALNGSTTITALFASSQTVALTVSPAGTGTGTVTSNPAGITCGTTCSGSYPYGSSVTLTALPATGSSFTGWSGSCSGAGSCTVSLTSPTSVSAAFTSQSSTSLTVSTSGKGTVTSTPAGINCGKTCSASFSSGTPVNLVAVPGRDFFFAGWSGAGCSGTNSCTVTVNGSQTVTAIFKHFK